MHLRSRSSRFRFR